MFICVSQDGAKLQGKEQGEEFQSQGCIAASHFWGSFPMEISKEGLGKAVPGRWVFVFVTD